MKLELEHLAPYLPYRLQFDYKGNIKELTSISNGYVNCNHIYKNVKPLLIPLTPIQNFVPLTTEECFFVSKGLAYKIPQWKHNMLVENHFDVFGLIDAGLAIDKTTI